jgi:hypothetical protein
LRKALLHPYLLGPAALLLIGGALFPSSGRDDVHIAFWSAWTLVEHGALLNYSGEALEQGSSLLHILLLALVTAITGLEIADIATPLSILFAALAVVEAGLLVRRLGTSMHWAVALAATSTPLVYWAFGALESTLVAYIVTAFVRSTIDALSADEAGPLMRALLWSVLYLLARPEAVFVATAFVAFAGVVCLRDRGLLKRLAGLWGLLLLAFAMLVLWRYATFGAWFPQPVSAKVDTGVSAKLAAAWWYFRHCLGDAPTLFLLLAVAGAALLRELAVRRMANRPVWLAAGMVLAQGAFAAASGGDWMEAARFLVPATPAICALAAWSALTAAPQGLRKPAGVALVAANLVSLPLFTAQNSTGVLLADYARYVEWTRAQAIDTQRYSFFELANRVHLRDVLFLPHVEAVVDELLTQQAQVTVVSSQGGMVPYHLFRERYGRLRFLDMGGLTSRDFTDCPVLAKNPLPRGAGGISMSDEFYLAHVEEFRDRCGIPIPDVYYNIDRGDGLVTRALEASGYFRVLYRQQTDVCAPQTRCPPALRGDMVLAVRATAPKPVEHAAGARPGVSATVAQ